MNFDEDTQLFLLAICIFQAVFLCQLPFNPILVEVFWPHYSGWGWAILPTPSKTLKNGPMAMKRGQ